MSQVIKTNADALVQPAVDHARTAARAAVRWVADHPDEAVVAAAPWAALMLATRRHDVRFTEAFLMAEVSYWCGLLAVREYRRWKAQPARPGPLLRKVT